MTDFNFKRFFSQYEALVEMAEGAFGRVKKEYGDLVKCKTGCSECCHALFDLTLVEAIYINSRFNEKFSGKQKEDIIQKANSADRKTYKLKRQAHKDFQKGKKEEEILAEMALEKVKCPLLNKSDMCDLYDYRPITCRLYGIPTEISGMGHTCGKSGFSEGGQYPTVKMGIIQKQLYEISEALVKSLNTKYFRMAEMIVPLSMAIQTVYNEEYLGILKADDKNKEQAGKQNDDTE